MRKNLNVLKVLHKAKPKSQKAVLEHVEPSCIKALCDAILNVLKSAVKISPAHKRRIARDNTHLRLLTSKGTSLSKKHKVLVQKGNGFLSLVLGSVLKELSSLMA